MKRLTLQLFNEQRRLVIVFLVLTTALVAFGVQGFENGRVNNFRDQSVQLPIIYSFANPSLFSNDFFLEARQTYVTWFYASIGIISRMIPLDTLMLLLYLLAVGMTVIAVYALGETLFPGKQIGIYSVILWMAYFPNPGGDFLHSPFVTHTTFAVALEIWALVLIFRRKYSLAALLLGIAANINAMTSFFVTFAWVFALLVDRKEWSWKLLRPLGIMMVAMIPVLWWRFSLPVQETALDDFVSIIRVRLWYAVFPFSISALLWIGFFLVLALWIYSFRYGKPDVHHQVLGMFGGIGVLCVIAVVFSEIFPVEFLIELQLIRSTWLVNLLLMFYLANMVRQLLVSHRLRRVAMGLALIAAFAIPRWFIELAPPSQPTPYPLYVDLDTPWAEQNNTLFAIVLTSLIMTVLWVTWRLLRRNNIRPRYARLAFAWVAVAVVCFSVPGFLQSDVPPEQETMTAAWEDTLAWIAQNTPLDAQFVTPPMQDGFRVEAMRSQVGDWKDGTVGIFYNEWAIEWYERMRDLGFDEESFSFVPMTQERLCAVMGKYDADYAVVQRSWKIAGEPVYQNREFAVVPAAAMDCPPITNYEAVLSTEMNSN